MSLLHWDGKKWTADGTAPTDAQLYGVATSSAKLAYAVGEVMSVKQNGASVTHALLMQFNGTKWSNVRLPKKVRAQALVAIAMHGRSAWVIAAQNRYGPAFPAILHTTGGTWSLQKLPGHPQPWLNAASAESTKRADLVGGDIQNSFRTLLIAFNGQSWKPAPSGF